MVESGSVEGSGEEFNRNRFVSPHGSMQLQAGRAAKRAFTTSILSPARLKASKVLIQSFNAHTALRADLASSPTLLSPICSPSRGPVGKGKSPIYSRRVITRDSPLVAPTFASTNVDIAIGISTQAIAVELETVGKVTNFSQLSREFEGGSMRSLQKHAHKVNRPLLQLDGNCHASLDSNYRGWVTSSPKEVTLSKEITDSGMRLSPPTQPSHFQDGPAIFSSPLANGIDEDFPVQLQQGSPEHSRISRRLPPPSIREKQKGKQARKGKSLSFAGDKSGRTGAAADGIFSNSIAIENVVTHALQIPPGLQTTSRLRSGSRLADLPTDPLYQTCRKVYVGVAKDVFCLEDLSPLERLVDEVTCELLSEYDNDVSGLPMVVVRCLNPPQKVVHTFRSCANFDFDYGSGSEGLKEIDISQSATEAAAASISSIREAPIEINQQSTLDSDIAFLCEDFLEGSDEDDWCPEGEFNSGSEGPGSEGDDNSDWEEYQREVIEEDLPKLGHYPDDKADWEKDPFEWKFSDEFWSDSTSKYSHDTTFKGAASIPAPKLNGQRTPIGIFNQILDENCIRMIVTETNRYAQASKYNLDWKDLTRGELKAWLGISIYMGICRLPARRHHWRTDEGIFKHRMIPSIMTRDRFESILRNLHLVDNTRLNLDRADPAFDKICKVRPFMDRIGQNSRALKAVDEQLTIDEMMILGGGRLCPIMQHNPNKPIKHGIKILATCSASTKYVYHFSVYCGAENNASKSIVDQTIAMLKYVPRNLNHRVTMDNWFSSVLLFDTLLRIGILCLGTIRTNRVGWPSSMTVKYEKANQGDLLWAMHRSGSISAAMWMDHTQVALLSTCVRPVAEEVVKVRRWSKKIKTHMYIGTSPMLIAYQIWMRGVDVHDQMREAYSLGQKTRKWWHRLFWFAIDTVMTNSWILYKLSRMQAGQSYGSHLSFLLNLATSLTGGFPTTRKSAQALGAWIPGYAQRGGGIHYTDRSKKRLVCVECQRRTRMACPRCHWAGMCIGACFVIHHQRRQNCCNVRC